MTDSSTAAMGVVTADVGSRPAGTTSGVIPLAGGLSLPQVERCTWSLIVPGEPVAKGRPRIGVINGHAMAFTPSKTRTYESEIRALAYAAWGAGRLPLDNVAVELTVRVYRAIPISWSQKKQAAAREGSIRPLVKPDTDNFWKSAADALNGVVLRDDSLIVDAHVSKWYSDRPRLEIVLAW